MINGFPKSLEFFGRRVQQKKGPEIGLFLTEQPYKIRALFRTRCVILGSLLIVAPLHINDSWDPEMCRSLWQQSSTNISSFSKETYNFRDATDRRHPICRGRLLQIIIRICVHPWFVTIYGHVQRFLGQYFQVYRGFPVVRDY